MTIMIIIPEQMSRMTDQEIGIHLSGGYGAEKRNAMVAAIRAMIARCVR